ncbi:cytochrome P450/NADPH-cytochrome P450 reductase [Saccharopolyspora erythraea NRRL 2338]|uniref:Bifunctional cytochrome P450/NADPH--P450 reductase n=2 Tax=Saccharopolyspora erythraea TaxID=1836 RepID=A4FHE9_SACEN|nr:cytochrome P450 [Saccharopolyspora erythraea]EQD86894.1 P450 reductase [Saccharopolyspora erythraea D]PFG97169.1 cytochrome P450/NADPH-cytochrome P450 reductase [Saccharopolyspora erythraea NRRL 2338]QRK87371.1 cytochrome P450 [Saccharopolyspora erythraea]CAM03474.1 bifunctional P-450:NADPH-P450 reductase 1 [Saccharopolyspora erythraea NRRL 2338]
MTQTPLHHDDVPVADVSGTGLTATPTQQAMELARRHGPVFRRRTREFQSLLVSDVDLVAELSDEQRFAKAVGPALENVREFAADGLFTAYNDEFNWAKAHDILMPAFALGSMRTYHPVMLRVARRLLDSWDRAAAASAPVDVPDDMTRMTLDTIGLAGFGFDFGSFGRAEPHPFVGAMVRCLDWSMTRLSRVPGTDHSERDEAFRADARYLASVVDEVINTRAAEGDTSGEDLLGLMLGARHPADGTTLDAANIRNQIITFLIAGHETTSGTLSFALHYLAKNPTVLRLVQREADELWGDSPDPEPSFEDIGRLTYTRQVLNETLRLWPSAPAFGRQARHDTVLGGRIPMRAGEAAAVLIPMLHRSPVRGDNPELFDPARFAPEAEAARGPHAFKPFGTGERACIGRQFALDEATMVLAMLAHRYRLVDHAGYRLKVKETLTLKPEGLTLAVRARTAADRVTNRLALPVGLPSAAPGEPADAARRPGRVLPGTGLLLLHGSNYGTCRDFAAQLALAAGELGCDTAVAPLDEYAGNLPSDRPVIVVAASYNGRPTDDAVSFSRWLDEAEPGAADGVDFAVLGVGDRNWAATYQHVPTRIDARLAELGGTRILERGEADASGDLAGAVRRFSAALETALLERSGDPDAVAAAPEGDGPAYTVSEVTGGALDSLAARHGMVEMTVTEVADLTAPDYPRTKRFVRLALPEGTAYRTADHLAVLPVHDAALVERAAGVLGVDLDTVLDIRAKRPGRLTFDRSLTVRELLSHHVELQDPPTPDGLDALAALNPCPPERAALRGLAEEARSGTADHRTLWDLIEDHPALRDALSWSALLELLPATRPRQYSVSSSPAVDPRHVDLMVSVLRAPARSGRGEFRGAGSRHLSEVRPGDTVLARVQPCREDFRVAPDEPLIMVAAGTGLAPFRGVIADRRERVANGARQAPALCYFGCDAPDADYLHSAELRAAESAGAVAMRPAFNEAPVGGQCFVQHRIAAEAGEVWALLESGARVLVCGDGRHMAPGVREAFRGIYRERTPGADDASAHEWLQAMIAGGCYVEDVYAG